MSTFTGTTGDDSILGTDGDDDFHIEQGGNDSAAGAGGRDVFWLGDGFTASDHIDGGAGESDLVVVRDADLVLGAATMTGVENLFSNGVLTVTAQDDLLSAGEVLTVSGVSRNYLLDFDGSQETDGRLRLFGGQNADTLIGGAGRDKLEGRDGDDHIEGGDGNDHINAGRGADTVFGGEGRDKIVAGAGLDTDRDLVDGGGGDDRLHGFSAGTLNGGDGDDLIIASGGHHTIDGGLGQDTMSGSDSRADHFLFHTAADSTAGAPDQIDGLMAKDVIDLSGIDADATVDGDQAFTLVASLDGHAGQAALVYEAGADVTRLELDTDGDAVADSVIELAGDQTGFSNFVL